MLKYLVTLFIGLFSIFSFAYYEKYSVIKINTFSDKTITSVINANGDVINASEIQFDQLNGYPAIEDYNDSNGHYVSYHKGRFLAQYKNEYCLIDTTCRIVIDFCDTIVSIFLNPPIYERAQSDVFFEKFYFKYGYDAYYQAIKNGATFLYNNSGEQIFENSFNGLLCEDYLYHSSEYYITRNFDWMQFGILDKTGKLLLANEFMQIRWLYHHAARVVSNYYVVTGYNEFGVFNVTTGTWVFSDTCDKVFIPVCNDIYMFKENNKYGLFEINDGIIFSAKYDTIISPDRYGFECYEKSKPLILKKGRQKKVWRIPKKYCNL